MYVADDAVGIYKFTRSSSSGTFGSPVQINATKCRGIVVDYTTTPYTIYATTATGTRRCTSCNAYSDSLIQVVDSGAGSRLVYLATAPANTNFRGLTFSPTPNAKISATTGTICSGTRDSVIIYGNPGATVNYFINGTSASVVVGANGRAIIDTTFVNTSGASATNTFVLSSISTSVGSFTLSGSATIIVNSGAAASLTGSATVCAGSPATIAISGGTPGATVTLTPGGSSFTLDGSGAGSVAVTRTTDTVYTATIAYGGCTGSVTGTFPVTVNPLPTPTISGTASIFTGASTNITFGSTPGATVYYTVSGSSATDSLTLDGTGTAVVTASPVISTTYRITGIRSTAGCFVSANDSAVITVSSLPSATISGTATICAGTSTNLVFSGTGAATVRYTWGGFTDSVTLSGTSSGAGSFTVAVTPTVTTTYSLVSITSGTYTGSLSGSATVTVVPTVSAGTIAGPSAICVAASSVYSVTGTTGGSWSSSAPTVASVSATGTVYGLTAGTATITYRVSNTCFADSVTTSVTVNALPVFSSISGTATIVLGSSTPITFTGTPSATVTYTYTGGSATTTTLNATGTATVTVTPTVTTTYSVTGITSAAGCSNTATGSVIVSVQRPFTRYNIVVDRIGDGVNTLGSSAFPQTVVEYTTTGSLTGAETAIPSASGSVAGTESGSATSGGQLTLDSERTHIIVTGYNAAAGTSSVASGAGINRTVFSVLPSGIASNVSNVSQTYAYNTNNIRSGTAAGNRYYAAGTATTTTLGGIRLMTDTSSSAVSTSPATNTRVVQIFNGQLYYTTASATPVGVYKVGTGIPTSSTTGTNVAFTGTTGVTSPYSFSFSPDKLTMYIADDGSSTGGIYRFDRTSDTATFAFTRRVTATTSRSLVVDYTTTPYIVFATTGSSAPNHIIKIRDTGSLSRQDTLAASGTKYIFRGIAFSPASYAKVKGTVATVCTGTADTVVIYGNPGATVAYTFNGSASTVALDGTGMKRLALGTLTNTTPYPVVDTFRITGVTTSLGTSTINDSTLITVNPRPFVPAITGATDLCVGGTMTVADTATGGTWSTYDTTIAVISAGGVVTPRTAGVDTIYYSKTNGCGTTTVSVPFNVNALPVAGTITPSFTTGCASSLLTLTNTGATGTGTLLSYNWSGPGYTHTTTSAVDTVTPLSPSMSGVFSLTVTYAGSGCTSTAATTTS
ncbi:MAG: hypothetical protein EBZ77_06645, partial [Chitinophagia bacterium]|nr:hypothetical protein [Chitinophagia bacterium]